MRRPLELRVPIGSKVRHVEWVWIIDGLKM